MTVEYRFKHDVDTVFGVLTDPQFLVDRCIALGGVSAEGEAEEVGDNMVVITHRTTRSELPGLLKKLIGAEQSYTLKEIWQPAADGWQGRMTVDIKGQPLDISARFELKPAAGGCVYRLQPRASASIPVIGNKVEQFILQQFERDATSELNYTGDHLDGL